jgi:hypothetical protein
VIEVRVEIEIERSAADVFDFVTDMANNTRWQNGMRSCRWTSEPPIGVGSTYDQVASFLGREIVTSFEVVEHEPPTSMRIVSTKSTFPLDITRTVTARGEDTCSVEAIVRGEPTGPMGWFAPIMRPMVARSVNGDYERLKTLLES